MIKFGLDESKTDYKDAVSWCLFALQNTVSML